MNSYQEYIHKSRYARWLDDEKRRETWPETVDRYVNFMVAHAGSNFPDVAIDWGELREAIVNLEVMPSMRALMTAGPALIRCNVAGYNCAYLPVDSPRSFDETMYILMCGTGVGFSVERQNIQKLPEVPKEFRDAAEAIIVPDSKVGWAGAFRSVIASLYRGVVPTWDTSRVRPAGARLKTFGGRASGPEPLEDLFRFTVETFKKAAGRKLNSIECHDLMCKIGEVVVVGGVRRSALISLSNLTDARMRDAKHGEWWVENGQRALANNSVCYTEKPDMGIFLSEWKALYDSKSGERGIFNREAARAQAGMSGRRKTEGIEFGCNPCSEIILRPYQFCNLTEVVLKDTDYIFDIERKVRVATILGTLQATLSDFSYLRDIWQRNTEEERLLGVSLTGIYDAELVFSYLEELKKIAIETNKELAEKIGINQSTAITCVKPSGTVSQLVDSASGMHPRWAPFYIRTVRGDNKDPVTQFLIQAGVPHEPDVMNPSAVTVFSFPQKAPGGSSVRSELSAINCLNDWETLQELWCEHKPSITVNVRDHEWMEVGAWVWEHFDKVSGVSFLPYSEHTYRQAPYQEITEAEYNEWVARMPTIDWKGLEAFEQDDNTTASQEYACLGNSCEWNGAV